VVEKLGFEVAWLFSVLGNRPQFMLPLQECPCEISTQTFRNFQDLLLIFDTQQVEIDPVETFLLAQEPYGDHILEGEKLIGDNGADFSPTVGTIGDLEQQALNLKWAEDRCWVMVWFGGCRAGYSNREEILRPGSSGSLSKAADQ
jgi:hypothetical protein